MHQVKVVVAIFATTKNKGIRVYEYCDTFISAGSALLPFSRGAELYFFMKGVKTDEQIKRCFIRQRVN